MGDGLIGMQTLNGECYEAIPESVIRSTIGKKAACC
jgi:hypothetical protein